MSADFAALLAGLSPAQLGLYTVARACLDELERAAPWPLLYHPPDDAERLRPRLRAMLAVVDGLTGRLRPVLESFADGDSPGALPGPTRDEAEFFFAGILGAITPELDQLRVLCARSAGEPFDRDRASELAADLKGKLASSLMAATASLAARGRGTGAGIEPLLFPERAEEIRLTHLLVEALPPLLDQLRQLATGGGLAELLATWRAGRRADPYALADLVALRGRLGSLLKEGSRRAFYSGDYLQVRLREVELAERLGELERLHRASWGLSEAAAGEFLAERCEELEELLCGVAALLDVRLLGDLVGAARLAEHRAAAIGRGGGEAGAGPPAPRWSAWLAQDDLRVFLEMLHGSVRRRASLATERRALATPRPAPDPAASVERLRARLAELRAPSSADWRSFRMVHQLLARRQRLPAAMLATSWPLVERVRREILPELVPLGPALGISPAVLSQIEGSCQALLVSDPTPGEVQALFPAHCSRLLSFLDALRAVVDRRRPR